MSWSTSAAVPRGEGDGQGEIIIIVIIIIVVIVIIVIILITFSPYLPRGFQHPVKMAHNNNQQKYENVVKEMEDYLCEPSY